MFLLGKILGWLIVASFFLTVLNFPVRQYARRKLAKLPKDSAAKKRGQAVLRLINGGHRVFAAVATVALLAHFAIQFSYYGWRLSGVVAAILLITQGTLGAYGTYVRKRKPSAWLIAHRTVAVLLIAALLAHILRIY
jgi:hypothetical protein